MGHFTLHSQLQSYFYDVICNHFGIPGGPLLSSFDGESGDWVLSGLVSWGIPCAVQGFPGVFTNVSALLDFIQKYVNA